MRGGAARERGRVGAQVNVERERDVILREMEEVEGQIEEVVFDRLHEVAYVGTPLSRTILGPVENIQSISSDDIVRYVQAHYTAPRMVLAAAGAVDHDELHSLAEKHFSGVPAEAPAGLDGNTDAPALFSGADVRDYDDSLGATHFALAFEGLRWTDPDVFALMLCQSLLGTYDAKSPNAKHSSSPMVSTLARHSHLADFVQPFCTCYHDTGLFGVYAQANIGGPADGSDLLQIIQDELVSLTTGVSDDDLERAKSQLKFNMLQQMDGTSPTAEEVGRQLLTFGRRMHLAEMFARIEMISTEDLQRVAERVIWDQEVAFAGVGKNLKYVGDINALRRGTFWNRF